ncbi:MAG: FAD-dependent thymidylate synthase [Candidatus Bilamarchaeaceae archaeon]
MMGAERRIYSIKGYPEETVSASFAKTSRSPEPFDKILSEMNEESARKFHETWVIKFGHGSVAEHASVHIAAENVSRLSIECIESNRLAAYTEKSTRYQKLDREHVHYPSELKGTKYEKIYAGAIESLFSSYESLLSLLMEYYKSQNPRKPDEPEKKYEASIRLMALDSARFLLPNATLANVGITMNARTLQRALVKMLSSPLSEVREIGAEIGKAAQEALPTLGGMPQPSQYIANSHQIIPEAERRKTSSFKKKVELVSCEKDALEKIIAAFVYRHSGISFHDAYAQALKMGPAEKRAFISKALQGLSKEPPLREFEHAYYTFDLVMDQGAFCEFKRHRMLTLSPQEPTVHLGYTIPEDVKKAGAEKLFTEAMEESAHAFKEIEKEFPFVSGYISTNAHNRRCLATMNLRELNHFIRLRSTPWAHFTIREVAKGMLAEIQKAHPDLAFWIEAKS